MNTVVILREIGKSSNTWSFIGVIAPCIISILTLIANIVFYIYVAPRRNMIENQKECFRKEVSSFIEYLSDIISFESFDGIPSEVAKKSRVLQLYFTTGDAPDDIRIELEKVFHEIKRRKSLNNIEEIGVWNENFRAEIKTIRKLFAKYTGIIKAK